MKPIAESFFSGASLIDVGLARAGVEVVRSYELDAKCVKVARQNGHNSIQCDITQKLVKGHGKSNVRVFTWPCTKYSTIADIHGCRTGDDLYLHGLRHMVIDRPDVFVCENVPGMRKFPLVMEVLTELSGYYVTVFCPVQSQLWLPQQRDRLIIIGSRKAFNWRLPKSSRRTPLSAIVERDPQVTIPKYFYKRVNGGYRDLPIISDPAKNDLAPTCVAHYAKDVSTRVIKDRRFPKGVRPYTVREYARLQGLPDSFSFAGVSNRDAYRMIGNGVSVPVGEWIGRELIRYFAV